MRHTVWKTLPYNRPRQPIDENVQNQLFAVGMVSEKDGRRHNIWHVFICVQRGAFTESEKIEGPLSKIRGLFTVLCLHQQILQRLCTGDRDDHFFSSRDFDAHSTMNLLRFLQVKYKITMSAGRKPLAVAHCFHHDRFVRGGGCVLCIAGDPEPLAALGHVQRKRLSNKGIMAKYELPIFDARPCVYKWRIVIGRQGDAQAIKALAHLIVRQMNDEI